jgi:hypothetical protein
MPSCAALQRVSACLFFNAVKKRFFFECPAAGHYSEHQHLLTSPPAPLSKHFSFSQKEKCIFF